MVKLYGIAALLNFKKCSINRYYQTKICYRAFTHDEYKSDLYNRLSLLFHGAQGAELYRQKSCLLMLVLRKTPSVRVKLCGQIFQNNMLLSN